MKLWKYVHVYSVNLRDVCIVKELGTHLRPALAPDATPVAGAVPSPVSLLGRGPHCPPLSKSGYTENP